MWGITDTPVIIRPSRFRRPHPPPPATADAFAPAFSDRYFLQSTADEDDNLLELVLMFSTQLVVGGVDVWEGSDDKGMEDEDEVVRTTTPDLTAGPMEAEQLVNWSEWETQVDSPVWGSHEDMWVTRRQWGMGGWGGLDVENPGPSSSRWGQVDWGQGDGGIGWEPPLNGAGISPPPLP